MQHPETEILSGKEQNVLKKTIGSMKGLSIYT